MKLAEAEKPLQDLLDAAKKAFEANGKVSVRDVWGVPVVEINLTFSGEAREIIYNITKD